MVHEEDVRPPNEKTHAIILALLTTDVIFANWTLLQFLLSLNAYLKDVVCKLVVSFAFDSLVIAFEIVRYLLCIV